MKAVLRKSARGQHLWRGLQADDRWLWHGSAELGVTKLVGHRDEVPCTRTQASEGEWASSFTLVRFLGRCRTQDTQALPPHVVLRSSLFKGRPLCKQERRSTCGLSRACSHGRPLVGEGGSHPEEDFVQSVDKGRHKNAESGELVGKQDSRVRQRGDHHLGQLSQRLVMEGRVSLLVHGPLLSLSGLSLSLTVCI